MQRGKVKWYDKAKGYGFIKPDNGSPDVFVHFSEIENSRYTQLSADQLISYEVQTRNGKPTAFNLNLI
jgi:CspA family cold shock protein